MKKIINQAPIARYRASVSEIFFLDSWNGTFSAESNMMPEPHLVSLPWKAEIGLRHSGVLRLGPGSRIPSLNCRILSPENRKSDVVLSVA